jgi:hypothetical protein
MQTKTKVRNEINGVLRKHGWYLLGVLKTVLWFLTIDLRATTIQQESFKTVYNWQYVHCIDFWANVLSTYCSTAREGHEKSPLHSMVYPLAQIAIGAIRYRRHSLSRDHTL